MRWIFGAAQFSEWDADGFLGVQIDPAASDEAGASPLGRVQAPYGFFSRPRDPDADGRGCSVLVMERGDRERYAWLGSDPRTLDKIPDGAKGTAGLLALTDSDDLSFLEVDGETGTQSLYVPVGSSAHLMQVGVDSNGASVVKIQHSEGMAIVMFDSTVVIHNAGGDGYLQVDGDGVTCNGNMKLNGGLDVGGSGALPFVLQPALATAISAYATTAAAAWSAFGSACASAVDPVVQTAAASIASSMATALSTLAAEMSGTASVLTKGK